MWVAIDDNLPDHPKLWRAGETLGQDGFARAFTLYVSALAYANRHLTDGFIPDGWVQKFAGVWNPKKVSAALESAGLFLKTDGGFAIHDFHDFNPKAKDIKKKRAKDRKRKRDQRSRRDSRRNPRGLRTDSARNPERSRARDPLPLPLPSSTSTNTKAPARQHAPALPTHGQLCAIVREQYKLSPDVDEGSLTESIKVRCAQLNLIYSAEAIGKARDAVDRVQRKANVG